MLNSLTFLLLIFSIQTNSNLDFEPKLLVREIKKISGCDNPISQEYMVYNGGKFYKYSNANPVWYSYLGRVYTCRSEGCKGDNNLNSSSSSEYFDYFIIFDSNARILSVQVYNYAATHGQEITLKSWLNQFVGYNGSLKLTVGKEIDGISGATTSVNCITNDIVDKTVKLNSALKNKP